MKESSLYNENITPRQQAKYKSPKRKTLTRKKKANPENWKKNIRKIKCQSGLEYESSTGKTVKARGIKQHSCSKCRFNCADKVSEDERLSLFNDYWNLKSYQRQRDYEEFFLNLPNFDIFMVWNYHVHDVVTKNSFIFCCFNVLTFTIIQ